MTTACRNRKASFIAEVTEPEDSREVSYYPCDESSKSSAVCEFRGATSVCGERPRVQDNEFTSLIGKSRPRNSKKITSYGTVRCQEADGAIGSCRDLSGDNDSCCSASADELSSSGSSGVLTSKLTHRQILVLAMVLVNSFSSSLTVCLFPPFYPRLAEMKGTTASSYGMIIGTNCLVAFLTTPFIGNQLPLIGVKFSFCFGTFAGGVCCALSGLLEFFEPGQSFIIFSVLLRIFHACANALVITSTFAYQAMEFPGSVAKVFSITRCVMNVTQLFGPLMGGVLHEAGGFYLPFAVMGGFQILLAFLSIFMMPPPFLEDSEDEDREYGHSKKNKLSVRKILSIPTIWFSFVAFIIATMCNGFISVNLEPEVLRQFQLSPIYIGLVFGLKDGANSIASPIWGFVCDNNKKSVKPYLIVSAILVALSFFILGAGDLLGFTVSLTIPSLVAALCINGVGIGGQQVVGVVDALHEASRAGYPENAATQGLVAGMWSSLSGAGRFVSRAGSGLLVDGYGFSPVTSIACGLQLVVALVTFLYLVTCECSLVARESGLKWEDVTIVEHGRRREDQVVFANGSSPSESLMGHSVQVGVSIGGQKVAPRIANSMPPVRRWSFSEAELSRSVS